ncbi:hypothetical protein N7495_007979 [Penicillium taxi]|uniref:uncharacterized protein n=1 Tax=Penicillium taxi TaxID=168475 RepID=UPI002545067C|nr:uncharacterized protein N7495_007979 [Penicillium taxi]KAJ5887938.1 hypothetical protein N7495_007979 [Penicillium taxi]
MKIRYPFAGGFALLLVIAAYIGLLPHSTDSNIPPGLQPNDKFLHLVTFFLLSVAFYWILDTTRRRTLHLTLLVCTLGLGIGSEIVQALLPNDRPFDLFDIVANVVGSLGAVGLCSWYHRRMLERRRKNRFGVAEGTTDDVELGVGIGSIHDDGLSPQETGVTSLEHEVDNWDENAVDNWDTDDGPGPSEVSPSPPSYQDANGGSALDDAAAKRKD